MLHDTQDTQDREHEGLLMHTLSESCTFTATLVFFRFRLMLSGTSATELGCVLCVCVSSQTENRTVCRGVEEAHLLPYILHMDVV